MAQAHSHEVVMWGSAAQAPGAQVPGLNKGWWCVLGKLDVQG